MTDPILPLWLILLFSSVACVTTFWLTRQMTRSTLQASLTLEQQARLIERDQTIASLNATLHAEREQHQLLLHHAQERMAQSEATNVAVEAKRRSLQEQTLQLEKENASLSTKLEEQQGFAKEWQTHWKQQLEAQLKTLTLEHVQLTREQLTQHHKQLEDERLQQFGTLVEPLTAMLTQYDGKLSELSQQTTERISILDNHVQKLGQAKDQLVNILASTKGVGDWGEVQLLRILEFAGLQRDIHYAYQSELPPMDGETAPSKQRPDVQLLLPDNRIIIIDAKAVYLSQVMTQSHHQPHESALDASEETLTHLQEDSKALVASLRKAIKDLASKHYTKQRSNTPDFVILFLPKEHLLTQALEAVPTLWEEAWHQHVLLSSPLTLLATLRLVWTMWQQHQLEQNVHAIRNLGKKVHEKLVLFTERFEKVEKHQKQLQQSLEEARRSFDGRQGVATYASKLAELGCDSGKTLPASFSDSLHRLEASEGESVPLVLETSTLSSP